MERNSGWNFLNLLGGLILLGCLLSACAVNEPVGDRILFTSVPVTNSSESIISGAYKYTSGQVIKMIETGAEIESAEILTDGFHSARAPEISYDGKSIVFSGQRSEHYPWQIWIMDLKKKQPVQVTHSESNCTDPVWLPDGRIAFSKLLAEYGLKHHALFTIDPDGCCEQRITYQPHDDLNAMVMNDGRLLFSSRQLYPEEEQAKFLAMRPDGTKAELFFKPASGNAQLGKAIESVDEELFFAESGTLTRIRFSRPLHSQEQYIEDVRVHSSAILKDRRIVLSIQLFDQSAFALSLSNEASNHGAVWISDNSAHLIEPVATTPGKLPRKLPSLLNISDPNGYLICMDVAESELISASAHPATKVQVLGMNKIIGETPVEEDGSFYLALPADAPMQFQTINEFGEVVRGPSGWLWVRPSEHKSCVGCHANRELAPENVVPMAVNKMPLALGD